jgi:hypothetical protein
MAMEPWLEISGLENSAAPETRRGHPLRALANVVDGPDQPHTDTASIALKGIIWAVSLACLIVTLTSHYNEQSAGESRSRN